jgi:UPF0755 protein
LRRALFITAVAAVALILALTAIAGIWIRSEIRTRYYGNPAGETFLEIPRGANSEEVADLLLKNRILRNRLPFIIYLRYTKTGRHIKAGEYRFSEPATPAHIAQRLIRGDVYFRAITIPEGLTARETIELLTKAGLGNPAELEAALLRTDWIQDLNPKARDLEGYLFPETYRFGRNISSDMILKIMVDQFRTSLAGILSHSPMRAGWNVSQIVILASMIEKEVKKAEEGPLVASVLINRLNRGIPLACDATIIYALKLAGRFDGRIHKADLGIQSPYNSYTHPNLPPGPIANPGANSLRAALNPSETDFLYYVSRNDGTHQFSRDFGSHLRAVQKFQTPLARKRALRPKSGS